MNAYTNMDAVNTEDTMSYATPKTRRISFLNATLKMCKKADDEEPEERPIVYIGGRRRALTKAVPPQWYTRYCHVLPDAEKISTQPKRDFLTDGKLLRDMEQMKIDEIEEVDPAEALAQNLEEERTVKQAAITDIANGNFERATKRFQSLKLKEQAPLDIAKSKQRRHPKTIAGMPLRLGGFLKNNSKWKLLTQNRVVVQKLKDMKIVMRRKGLVYKFCKAIRLIRTVLRFGKIIADISRATSEVFKEFNESMEKATQERKRALKEDMGLCFDKSLYESTFLHRKKIDEASLHTLRNLEYLRTDEDVRKVAIVLSQNCRAFRDFPANLQLTLARSGWYVDVPKDRVIIREGQEPNNFYFMLSGKTIAVKMRGSCLQEETGRFELVCEYKPNDVFGHQDIHDCKHRTYSVLCAEDSVLISVSYVDYMRVSALPLSGQHNPDHLKFVSRLSFMRHFPTLKLIRESGDGNVFCFYFQQGVVLSKNIRRSDYIFVIKKGKCTVFGDVTKLNPYKRNRAEKPLRKVPTRSNLDKLVEKASTTFDLEKPLRIVSTASDFSAYPVLPDIIADQQHGNKNQSASSAANTEDTIVPTMQPLAPTHRRKRWDFTVKLKPICRVVLKELIEGEVIGIEHVDLGDDVEQCDVSVVSAGCEVVLVKKDFFLCNASPKMQAFLRGMSFVFPTQAAIKEKLRNQRFWEQWKEEYLLQTEKNRHKTAS